MKLPKNARGGYKIPAGRIDPDPVRPVDRAGVYGPSTQCPPDQCGHRLTERHWKPSLAATRGVKR